MLKTVWRRKIPAQSPFRSAALKRDADYDLVYVVAYVDEHGTRHDLPGIEPTVLPPGALGETWVAVVGVDEDGNRVSPRAKPLRVRDGQVEGYEPLRK